MCKCIEELQKQVAGDKLQDKTIRKAEYIDPKLRLSFCESTARKTIVVDTPYCPICGRIRRPLKQPILQRALNIFATD